VADRAFGERGRRDDLVVPTQRAHALALCRHSGHTPLRMSSMGGRVARLEGAHERCVAPKEKASSASRPRLRLLPTWLVVGEVACCGPLSSREVPHTRAS
jgi:hypothetical protein